MPHPLAAATRRHFLTHASAGLLGSAWLADPAGAGDAAGHASGPSAPPAARAKRVIHLHMIGAPSQLELFDYRPVLAKYDGEDCPQSYLDGQRFAFIKGVPKLLGPQFGFERRGESGAWVSDRLPHFGGAVPASVKVASLRVIRACTGVLLSGRRAAQNSRLGASNAAITGCGMLRFT